MSDNSSCTASAIGSVLFTYIIRICKQYATARGARNYQTFLAAYDRIRRFEVRTFAHSPPPEAFCHTVVCRRRVPKMLVT